MEPIQILLADGDETRRGRLRRDLEDEGIRFEVVDDVGTGEEALSSIRSLTPDVVLLTVDLPRGNGLELTRAVRQLYPTASVILLTQRADEEELFQAIRYGAAAYLPLGVSGRELADVIDRVRTGRYVIDDHVLGNAQLAQRVLNAFRRLSSVEEHGHPVFAPLSPREIEVLEHAARGSSNKMIARAMGISDQTVKNHLTSIMRKLAVNDRTHAVVYALQHGWIRVEDL